MLTAESDLPTLRAKPGIGKGKWAAPGHGRDRQQTTGNGCAVFVWVPVPMGCVGTEASRAERCWRRVVLAGALGRGAKAAVGPGGVAQRVIQAGERAQGAEQ